MSEVVILYTPPEHLEEFERRYHADYLPVIRALPAVGRVSTRRVVGGPLGGPPYYRIETWRLNGEATPAEAYRAGPWHTAPDTLRFARGLATPMFV
ncbi:MAG: hypothetical protein ACRDG4_04725, partial [Chloroflexota bacterium]